MTMQTSAPIFDHLWQSTLFVLFVGFLVYLLRKNRAHVRYWLWFAASLKFLIPFSWIALVGAALGLGDLDRGRLAGVDRWLEASLQPASAFMAADTEPRRDALPPVAEAGAEDAVAENDVPQSVSVDSQSRGSMWPFAIALGIGLWLCGTAVIIVAWLVRWLAIRRLIAAAAPIGDTMTGSFPVPMLESTTVLGKRRDASARATHG
jgi:hypothetical protein